MEKTANILPDHPIVAALLRDGEAAPASCSRCSAPAQLWSDELGYYCCDCAMALWDNMAERDRAALMGFEEL